MRKLIALVLFGVLLATPTWAAKDTPKPSAQDAMDDRPSKPDILEIMKLEGEIDDSMAQNIAQQVKDINSNHRITAVLLVVNSPGGGVIASSNINEELSKLKAPIVAWCNTMCASGGMYVLMNPSVKYIGVRKETVAGSIGVISSSQSYSRLLDFFMVDTTTFKSAPLKDAGNSLRSLTDEDKAYLQGIITKLAGNFYALINTARGPKITNWAEVKSAKIFFGQDAVDLGLVDGVMSYEAAVKKAKEVSKSHAIYTRDEMKAISGSVDDSSGSGGGYGNHVTLVSPSQTDRVFRLLSDLQAGQATKFEYLMPYQF